VSVGQKVKAGQLLCDSAATKDGSLALGRNVLVAFMSWEGFNFEDAIILSERLVKEDVYTSIHVDEFDVEIRETKLGREEFTRDIPNVSEKALRHLDDNGIVQIGTRVLPGDILVGKVSPKAKSELTPEEKLLHAIFGRAGEDVKNESLEIPSGVGGIVIHTERFSRRMSLSDIERKRFEDELEVAEGEADTRIVEKFRGFANEMKSVLGTALTDADGRDMGTLEDEAVVAKFAREFQSYFDHLEIRSADKKTAARKLVKESWPAVEDVIDTEDHRVNSMKRGDELPSGVLQMVKVYVASRRQISVGDKMAGRHVTKGLFQRSCRSRICHSWLTELLSISF
jgi:DNA-directed RNA polymerase subunit beta